MIVPVSAIGQPSSISQVLGQSGYTTMASDSTQATGSSSSTGSTTTGSSSSATTGGLALDPQAFLQLLVAQLKYQDPSNPVDTSSFMNQTAMLSQVQTMSSMGSTLSALADAQQAQSATALIGKQVTYLDSKGLRVSGVVTSAQLLSAGATLHIGDKDVPLSSVVQVEAAPSTSASAPSGGAAASAVATAYGTGAVNYATTTAAAVLAEAAQSAQADAAPQLPASAYPIATTPITF